MRLPILLTIALSTAQALCGQENDQLSIDRIFASNEFGMNYQRPLKWVDGGESYVIIESDSEGINELIRYGSKTENRSVFLSSDQITPEDGSGKEDHRPDGCVHSG